MGFEQEWTPGQCRLVDLLFDVYAKHSEWPMYQWVQGEMFRSGQDALDILKSFVVIGGPWSGGLTYSEVHYERSRGPARESRVGLTVAGLAKLPMASQYLEAFVIALRLAARFRRDAPFEPLRVLDVQLLSSQLDEALRGSAPSTVVTAVGKLLTTEPFRGSQGSSSSPNGNWSVGLGPEFVEYLDIDLESYLYEIATRLEQPPTPTAPRILSTSVDLPTALTYLDTTWRLHSAKPLLKVEDLAAVASLVYDAAGLEEFTARCGALGQILATMQSPSISGVDGHALTRLHAYLSGQLDTEDRAELDDAIATLQAVRRARNASAHPSGSTDGYAALKTLGISGPPWDWTDAWAAIQHRAGNALMDLRAVVARPCSVSKRCMAGRFNRRRSAHTTIAATTTAITAANR